VELQSRGACLAADVPRHRDAPRPLPKTSASSSYKSQMRDEHNRGRWGKHGKKDETEGERTREAERKREKQKEERERKKGDNR
jgi:hypothetical protein